MLSHCVFPKKNLLNWLNLRICNYTHKLNFISQRSCFLEGSCLEISKDFGLLRAGLGDNSFGTARLTSTILPLSSWNV
ncbi:unnamed protein product, partial [Brassica rapa subsp. narinosa]